MSDKKLIVGDNVSDMKIYEIINKYFGQNYTGWMKAWYDINDEYAAWFPTITDNDTKPNGSYGGTKIYSNTLSADGKTILETNHDSEHAESDYDPKLDKKRFVFGRINGVFKFLGIFKRTKVENANTTTFRHDRIAIGIDLNTFSLINDKSDEGKVVSEWFISGNPKEYNLFDAFHDLGKVDWRQTFNLSVDDIVYIYVSKGYQRVMFKCKVNKINLKVPEIVDRKYDLSGKHDGAYGRYMELEPIEEFNTGLFDRLVLEKYGFSAPQGHLKVKNSTKEYLDVVHFLLNASEMDPEKHDGSYELARETVRAYKRMNNLAGVDYRDLNLLYHMVIGTWKLSVEQKKKSVDKSNLPESEKERLKNLLDRIWKRAVNKEYENNEVGDSSIGMFGTGFYSFDSKDEGLAARTFLGLCIDILDLDNDEEIYKVVDRYFTQELLGLKAASASAMLHCLKPYTFPILNTNFGNNTIYEYFGIDIKKMKNLTTYSSNCRKIKAFRDKYFKVKNYRIYDKAARMVNKSVSTDEDDYWPSREEYDPGISTDQWIEVLSDPEVTYENNLLMLAMMFDYGRPATCTELAEKYGQNKNFFNAGSSALAKRVSTKTGCPLPPDRINENARWWPILYVGRDATKDENGSYVWKLRDELKEALAQMDLPLIKDIKEMNNTEIGSLNTILYGPPGTGKTYNSILYAVAICEGSSIEELQAEEYSDVIERFNKLRNEGRIAFTTFHQSYGYEEFIEGIKPIVDDSEDDDGDIRYSVEDGIFKKFCERASLPISSTKAADNYGLNKNPIVWKVSLEGTGDNPTRTECLENDHIRIGWDRYGEVITDDTEFTNGGRIVLNSFINKMQVGDLVLSCYSASTIDAIGVVTGDYEWHPEYSSHKRLKNVRWLAKNIKYNILELNGNTSMTLSTVYKMKLTVADVFKILDEVGFSESSSSKSDDKPYVFIIDEINRGNISKIFGELITLIEPSKRIGKAEELRVELPYSQKQFGVPDNVYILGTMNTADRSIALMDTALRRRFQFVEMMPDTEVLKDIIVDQDGETIDIAEMLKIINLRIEYLYDREHTIGHAYFMPLLNNPSIDTLAEIFDTNIIPLLKEYFYEDYGKIQMILGDNKKSSDELKFVKETKLITKDIFNGDTSELDLPEQIYSIQKEALYNIRSYKEISKDL